MTEPPARSQHSWTSRVLPRGARPAPWVARYGIALLASLGSVGLTLAFERHLAPHIFLFFFPAVAVAAWAGGLGPALLASLVAVVATDYLFLAPVRTISVFHLENFLRLAAFFAVAAMIASLTGSLRRSREEALASARESARLAAELEERVRELSESQERLQVQAVELEMQTEELQLQAVELEETREVLEEANAGLTAAAARAEEASAAKTTFLAMMSHELRTPLNAIAGYAQLLELGIPGPVNERQVEMIHHLQRSQEHLLRVINDVLSFARVESGEVQYRLVEVEVDGTLREVAEHVVPEARRKGVEYEYAPAPVAGRVWADPERVREIVRNLLGNAVKFTPSGGRVRLEWEPVGSGVEIRVRDTGRGIPAEKLESIFHPFVQVDGSLTREHDGSGLGLAISRDLARGMGGELRVDSEPGRGSTFVLSLPAPDGRDN